MNEKQKAETIRKHLESFDAQPVEYSVTLPGRKDPVLDSDGKPTDKTSPVKLPIPATIYEGTADQWRELYTAIGLDPDEQFAHFVNAAFKQGNESIKGDLRKLVVEQASEVKSKSNKAALEILAERPKIKKAIAEFAAACQTNIPTKPVKVASEKKRRLAAVEKIEAAAPGLVAKLATMSEEEIAAFLAQTAKEQADNA